MEVNSIDEASQQASRQTGLRRSETIGLRIDVDKLPRSKSADQGGII